MTISCPKWGGAEFVKSPRLRAIQSRPAAARQLRLKSSASRIGFGGLLGNVTCQVSGRDDRFR